MGTGRRSPVLEGAYTMTLKLGSGLLGCCMLPTQRRFCAWQPLGSKLPSQLCFAVLQYGESPPDATQPQLCLNDMKQ